MQVLQRPQEAPRLIYITKLAQQKQTSTYTIDKLEMR